MFDFDNDSLRAWAGLILLVIALTFILTKGENTSIEYVMIALAGFLVGGAMLGGRDK